MIVSFILRTVFGVCLAIAGVVAAAIWAARKGVGL